MNNKNNIPGIIKIFSHHAAFSSSALAFSASFIFLHSSCFFSLFLSSIFSVFLFSSSISFAVFNNSIVMGFTTEI
jgi:hypothetical protein